MKQKITPLFFICILALVLNSCKKDFHYLTLPTKYNEIQQIPTIRIDKYFPNGVLQFKSKESFNAFYKKVEQNLDYVKQVLPNFKSFKTRLDNFAANQSLSANNKQASLKAQGIAPLTAEIGQEEYLLDMQQEALPDEILEPIVDNNLEVIIENELYQFTRIGQFQVDLNVIDNYLDIIEDNLDDINYNPNFTSMPNENSIGNDQYQVSTGIIRDGAAIGDDILAVNTIAYLPEIGGGFQDPGGGSGGAPGTNLVPDYYATIKSTTNFDDKVGIIFNDWAKRRLEFKTNNTHIGFGDNIAYNNIRMKAKIQKEKKFLWITYWGPSYADELIIGFDNMSMETSYIFPHPNQVTLPNKPEFGGLADFQLGNYILKDVLHININVNVLGYCLSNSEVSSYLDNGFNSLVGNAYNNLYKQIETKILNGIDNNFSTRWDGYKKSIDMLDNQYKLKVVLGKAEKPQGYSHENHWRFDSNVAVSFKVNGGVSGGYPAQYSYTYKMKAGSFYARARVGNIWHGIRIIYKNL